MYHHYYMPHLSTKNRRKVEPTGTCEKPSGKDARYGSKGRNTSERRRPSWQNSSRRPRPSGTAQDPDGRASGPAFIANELEKMLDTVGIVDANVPANSREKGPSVGEYFFYAWANRLIEPKGKKHRRSASAVCHRYAVERAGQQADPDEKRHRTNGTECRLSRSRRLARLFSNGSGSAPNSIRNVCSSTLPTTTATLPQIRNQSYSSVATTRQGSIISNR